MVHPEEAKQSVECSVGDLTGLCQKQVKNETMIQTLCLVRRNKLRRSGHIDRMNEA